MHSTMFVACPASTGAFGSLRERMHSRKLRTCAGAARLKLPGSLRFNARLHVHGHRLRPQGVRLAADVEPRLVPWNCCS